MCDKQALEPASRVFGTTIYPAKRKTIECPPELFPPQGKGSWGVRGTGKKAKKTMKRLKPLLTKHRQKQWKKVLKECR